VRALAMFVATAGGLGYAPVAPGTFGSLAGLALIPLLAALHDRSGRIVYGIAIVALMAGAIWAAGRADEILPGHDHGRIVIDEVAGMVVGSLFVPATWGAGLLLFVLFRVFDVAKPFPANRIDRDLPGGLGVVADDLVAGLYAGIVCRLVLELT
jgi:phosphatidylglycerophosphatase A